MTNNKCQAIIKELSVRCKNVNTSLEFITQSYFKVLQDVRFCQNCTHYLMIKIHSTKELQNIAFDHSADIDYKNVLKIYSNCTNEPYSFLTIDITLPADNLTRFRKKIFRFSFIKMTLTEQFKILDDKIKANKAKYDLD